MEEGSVREARPGPTSRGLSTHTERDSGSGQGRKGDSLSGPKATSTGLSVPAHPTQIAPVRDLAQPPFLNLRLAFKPCPTLKCPSPDLAPGLSPNPNPPESLPSPLLSPLQDSQQAPVPLSLPFPLSPATIPHQDPWTHRSGWRSWLKRDSQEAQSRSSLTVGGSELCLKRSKHQAQSKVVGHHG